MLHSVVVRNLRWMAAWATLAACLFGVASPRVHAAAAARKVSLKYTETSLGKCPRGMRESSMVFSPDGRHVAYLVKGDKGWAAWLDGAAEKEHEWILTGSLGFTPDSSRLAYIVQRGERLLVVVGGVEGKEYKEVIRPVFSSDGKRMAYTAKVAPDSKGLIAVLDGAEGKEYENINPRSLRFSPDGKHFAFVADRSGKRMWVIDGVEGPLYDGVAPLVYSADSQRWAYMAERKGKQLIVIDGKESQEYDRAGGVSFSRDGRRVAYAAERGRRLFAVIDGVEGPQYDMVGEPLFSPDGKRVAYIVVRNKIWMVVVDGEEGQGYDRIGDTIFSGDSKHLVYKVLNEHKQRLVLDEKELKEYDRIGTFVISHDGSNLAYAARAVTSAGVGEWTVINEKEIPGPGFVTMSPDGRYVAHSCDTTTRSKVMVNDIEGREFNGFLRGSRWVFEGPRKFVTMVGKNMEIFRVEVEIVEE